MAKRNKRKKKTGNKGKKIEQDSQDESELIPYSQEEAFAKIREIRNSLRPEIESHITEILSILDRVDTLQLLCAVSVFGVMAFNLAKDQSRVTPAHIEYLSSLVAARPNKTQTPPTYGDVSSVINLLGKISLKTTQYMMFEFAEGKYAQDIGQWRMRLALGGITTSGPGYPSHLRTNFEKFICAQSDIFEKAVQFSPAVYLEILDSLPERLQEYLTVLREELASWSFEPKYSEEVSNLFAQEILDKPINPRLFSLLEISATTDQQKRCLELLSQKLGDNSQFENKGPFPYSMLNESNIHELPILKVGDKYYAPCTHLLLHECETIFEKMLSKSNAQAFEKFTERRGKALEVDALATLSTALRTPSGNTYLNLHFDKSEIDGLIELDDFIIIIQAKAGRVRPRSWRGDVKAFLDDMKALLVDASEQIELAENYLQSSDRVCFKDSKGKEVILQGTCHKKILSISVFLEPLGSFLTTLREAHEMGLIKSLNHVPFYINDLRILCEIAESSSFLINYLIRRSDFNRVNGLFAVDEIDLLGLHIHGGLPMALPNEDGPINHAAYEGFTEEIDKYFKLKERGLEATKPRQTLPPRLRMLIELLETKKPLHYLIASHILWNFDGPSRKDINEQLKRMEKKYRRDGLSHSVTLVVGDTVISLGVELFPPKEHFNEWAEKHRNSSNIKTAIMVGWSYPLNGSSKIQVQCRSTW